MTGRRNVITGRRKHQCIAQGCKIAKWVQGWLCGAGQEARDLGWLQYIEDLVGFTQKFSLDCGQWGLWKGLSTGTR